MGYAYFIESRWVHVRHVRLTESPTLKLIHISDIHFTGDTAYLEKAVRIMNGLEADAVCFTGDLVEEESCLPEALRILAGVNKPMYGIPGNHDWWAMSSFATQAATFRKTGGDWLLDDSALLPPDRVGSRKIRLLHYPDQIDTTNRYDLVLSGHTHGGQIGPRFLRRFILGFDVGRYDSGLFRTPAGPLYVNPGFGTYFFRARFLCRPEITLIEL
jgi:predicted MPP superfamily phosphohydrolase